MRCLWTATFAFLTLIGLVAQEATAQRSDRQSRHSEHIASRQADDEEDDDDSDDSEDDDRYERDDDDEREDAVWEDEGPGDRYTSQYGNDRSRSSRDYGRDRNPEIATDRNPGNERRPRMTERQSLSRSYESSGVDRDFDQDNNDAPHSSTRTDRQNRFDEASPTEEDAYLSRTYGPRSDRFAKLRERLNHDYSNGMWQRSSNSQDRNPASQYQEEEANQRRSEQWLDSMAESAESETVGEHNERFASSADEFIRQHDEDEDTYLSRDEMPQGMLENFHDLDRDGDNYVGRGELQQHGRNMTQWMRTAQDTSAHDSGNGGRGRVVPVEVTYVWIMDTEGGHVRLNDLQGAYDLLQRLDANNDGNITRSELRDRKQQVVSRWIEHGFNRLDENEDDAISRSEAVQTMLQERFERLDLDGDQQLTRSELRRSAQNASRWWGPQDEDAYLSEGQGDDERR